MRMERKDVCKKGINDSAYYPEVECGYIKYSGVKYLYKEGLKKTKVVTTAISLMISDMLLVKRKEQNDEKKIAIKNIS